MKCNSIAPAFGLLLLSVGIAPVASAAEVSCDLQSLNGRYDFSASGKMISTTRTESGELEVDRYELRNLRVMGTIIADGAGNASIRQTAVSKGFPPEDSQLAGTYTVNPDCTGKLSFLSDGNDFTVTGGYDFVLKKTGKFRFVSSNDHALIAGRAWQTNERVRESSAAKFRGNWLLPNSVTVYTPIRGSGCGGVCGAGRKVATNGCISCF